MPRARGLNFWPNKMEATLALRGNGREGAQTKLEYPTYALVLLTSSPFRGVREYHKLGLALTLYSIRSPIVASNATRAPPVVGALAHAALKPTHVSMPNKKCTCVQVCWLLYCLQVANAYLLLSVSQTF